jgi:hypothetical protein
MLASLLYLPAMLAVMLLNGDGLLLSVQSHPGSWLRVAALLVLAAVPPHSTCRCAEAVQAFRAIDAGLRAECGTRVDSQAAARR